MHRKRLRRYHEPGELHTLTFSCYRRLPLLTNNAWRRALSEAMDEAAELCAIQLIAFVFMPEHVHLLVLPCGTKEDLGDYLAACKRPVAVAAKADLQRTANTLLERLRVQERPGKTVFRFWQEGAGYDRNVSTAAAVENAIEYLHMNPVRRGLCSKAIGWHWSSARYYASAGREVDADLPKVTPLSAAYWQALEH